MRLLLALILSASLMACSTVVRSPVTVTGDTKVGIISFVGDIAKNRTWGTTVAGNSDLSRAVDWNINRYLVSGIQAKISGEKGGKGDGEIFY